MRYIGVKPMEANIFIYKIVCMIAAISDSIFTCKAFKVAACSIYVTRDMPWH